MALEAAYHYLQQLAVVHGIIDTSSTAAQAALLAVLLLLMTIRLASSTPKCKQQPLPLPPSPPGTLPIIGHLHLVGSQAHTSIRDLDAKHGRGGLLLLRVGAVPTLFVSSPSAAEAVLRTHDHVFASRPPSTVADIIRYGSSGVSFAPYGEQWRQAKKLLTTHMLSANKVHSFRHDRQIEVGLVVDKIREAAAVGTSVDLSELLSGYTNDLVCRAVLGGSHRKEGRNRLFSELTEINVSLLGGFNIEVYFPKMAMADVVLRLLSVRARRLNKRWDDLFEELIQEHLQSSKPFDNGDTNHEESSSADFIDVLLSLQEEHGLTRDNLKAILVDMFEAGIETSYLTLEYAMAELMNNPSIMKKLQKDVRTCASEGGEKVDMIMEEDLSRMPYLKATVKETLRLHPPAPFLLPHYSTADCIVDGYLIPSGTHVLVNAWALGRDPSSWDRPEDFMPERFLQEDGAVEVHMKGKDLRFLPFGSGRRICPGTNFGVATIEIMLATLMYHFDWDVPNVLEEGTDGRVDMAESFGLTLRRNEKLILVPKILCP